MTPLVLACHRGLGGTVRGMALVADDNFSARYDLDRERGIFSRPAHRLYGRSYVGRILVLKTAKGGVASAWMLRDMADRGLAPLALVFNTVNPILAQGAAFAGLALVDRFDAGDVTGLVGDGDEVEIAPRDGRLTIFARASRERGRSDAT